MKQSKISVIIPAYNHERFVGKAIESVLNQTFQEFELIIIDDGSTDNTAKVIKSYTDSRILYIYQENQDAFNAINRGLDMARGAFISILNSDDLYEPCRLKKLLQVYQQTGAECLFTDMVPIDEHGIQIPYPSHYWHLWHERNRKFYFKCGDLYTAFLKGNLLVTTSNLFLTANAVNKIGKFTPIKYLHDYDYMFRAMLALPGKVKYLDSEQLLYYRIHSSNTLKQGALIARRQDQELIKKYMLASLPKNVRANVEAGSERLIELGKEIASLNSSFSMAKLAVLKNKAISFLKRIL